MPDHQPTGATEATATTETGHATTTAPAPWASMSALVEGRVVHMGMPRDLARFYQAGKIRFMSGWRGGSFVAVAQELGGCVEEYEGLGRMLWVPPERTEDLRPMAAGKTEPKSGRENGALNDALLASH